MLIIKEDPRIDNGKHFSGGLIWGSFKRKLSDRWLVQSSFVRRLSHGCFVWFIYKKALAWMFCVVHLKGSSHMDVCVMFV